MNEEKDSVFSGFTTQPTSGHSLSPPPYSGATSTTTAQVLVSAESASPLKDQLMTLLGISAHLSAHNDRNIHFAYEKYKGYLQASQTLSKMDSWPGKKPCATDLIEVFVSKSMWFSHHKPAFSKVADYSEMVKWLEDSDDKGTDLDVWGVEKGSYSLMDLHKFVNNGGTLAEKKGKGKKKDVSEGSGKQTNKKVINKDVGQKKGINKKQK